MPAHIIASMIGQVLSMCKDHNATHAQCLPCAICQDTNVVATASQTGVFFKLQSLLPYGRHEWVVGYIPRFVRDLN